ncbi:hypothetical protein [Pseudomonas sp. NPDC089406]|uniref:hypothetical protein n=1 Tax=Pseudomonas sp. NPDC089406 TaxID=3364463 RepID=UPI00385057E5
MKTLLMTTLLAASLHAYAEQPTQQTQPEQDQALQDAEQEQTPHVRKKRSVGTSAGLPCSSGSKLVGNTCVPLVDFE